MKHELCRKKKLGHSIDLSEEVIDAFNVFRMLKRIISLDPICILPLKRNMVREWKEVCPPMDTLTVREILTICSQ